MAPSPSLFLAAVAQRTRHIRLGPLAYALPLYNPFRLIEEVCMLDHLSGGRLELGLTRGVSPYELKYLGVDANQTRAMFDEVLAILLAGLTQERLTFAGKYYHYEDVPLELQPLQRPYPPLWFPGTSLGLAEHAAQQGGHLVSLGLTERVRQQVEVYWPTWEAHKHNPQRLNHHVSQPKVGILRQIYVAETDAEAVTVARAAHSDWHYSITKLWQENNDQPNTSFSWETMTHGETLLVGSPTRVREQLTRLLDVSGCNYVICAFAWGSLPHEQALRSLRLFAEEVMPAFITEGGAAGV
jgi:alkanesulfonate monooxygenase SsuD/methylene tetrahydromethanopterin reductase-like flavin-dependent oxidoreductase (luciferase family)